MCRLFSSLPFLPPFCLSSFFSCLLSPPPPPAPQVVALTQSSLEELKRIGAICHAHNIKFLVASTHGLFGYTQHTFTYHTLTSSPLTLTPHPHSSPLTSSTVKYSVTLVRSLWCLTQQESSQSVCSFHMSLR